MTRDPNGDPRANRARGPRSSPGPSGSRLPRADTGPFPGSDLPSHAVPPDPRASGTTGPRWAPDDDGIVPGYEFEPRPSRPGRNGSRTDSRDAAFPPRRDQDTRRDRDQDTRRDQDARRDGAKGQDREPRGDQAARHDRGARRENATGQERRFRYTPTVSQPLAVPPQAPRSWTAERQTMPGFEFDPAATVGPSRAAPRDAYAYRPDDARHPDDARYFHDPVPGTSAWITPPRLALPPASAHHADHASARPHRSDRPRADHRSGRSTAALLESAGAEWVRLLRTFIPSPAKRTWSKQFRDGLQFRGWGTRVAVPILAMILLGVVIVVLADANSGNPAPTPDTSSLGFPPATLAGSQFTAAPNDRGITQTLGRVTSSGAEIVAVGSQTGARLARAQFFVSMDEGRSWTMGTEQASGGGPPPPGHAARFVAGGQGEWVAVGPDSIWTSGNGESWTLISQSGLPLQPGDQISVLKRTAGGFIAAGANVPNGDQAKSSPVIFMSVNGIDWERLGAAQLGLSVQSGGRVLNIRYAAVAGNLILVAGDVATTTTTGKKHRPVTVRTSAAWSSTDGGATWTPAAVPTGHGAQDLIVGEAPVGGDLVVLRPATIGGTPGQNPGSPGRQPGKNPTQAVDVYRSPNGTTWTFEATLTTPSGFEASMTNGGPTGATVTGTAGHDLVAFVSATGASWQQTQTFGTAGTPGTPGTAGTPGHRRHRRSRHTRRHRGHHHRRLDHGRDRQQPGRPGQQPAGHHRADPARPAAGRRHRQDPRRP